MKRREFITLLGGAAAWPLPARAQQHSKIWRVGLLSPAAASAAFLETVRLKLHELGYVDGRNLTLDVRHADGDFSRLPTLAAELVALRPDVIVALATPAVFAAQRATSSIPIVMAPATDPIASGFVKTLARPGGNITGISHIATDLTGKLLELLNILAPGAKRIAVLTSANPVHVLQIKEAYVAAPALGLTVVEINAALPADIDAAFETMQREHCDGLLVLADPRVVARIPELAARDRLPAIYQVGIFVRLGGLMSYGPDYIDQFRRAAVYVDKILKGADPSILPVEQPAKFELLINLKTAKALGLDVSATLLARADEVIE